MNKYIDTFIPLTTCCINPCSKFVMACLELLKSSGGWYDLEDKEEL